jgi:serine O-acetyltransferase
MEQSFNALLPELVERVAKNYEAEEIFFTKPGLTFPNRSVITGIIRELRRLMFPGYFGSESLTGGSPNYFIGHKLMGVKAALYEQIVAALTYQNLDGLSAEGIAARAEEICIHFFSRLPDVQNLLLKDVQAAFDGDPAAQSKEEVIFSYPGLFAIFVYRFAHELYVQRVPFIPRIMTEHAHSRTGIDINAGATIGEYFFMDHGTGIVIGETTIIGNHVKLYQGVTLGALSTHLGQQLSGVKRHPTIEDNVTIYSNASILGGDTVIGKNAVIGGSAFITSSIPADTKVSVKSPELTLKVPNSADMWVI